MDVRAYNREKWDQQVEQGNPWTIPSSPEVILAARQGKWAVLLTEFTSGFRGWAARADIGRRRGQCDRVR
jgi:hypothetical protein